MSQDARPARALQRDLDREQAAVDLDQGIADREQARADRAQEPLDAGRQALEMASPASDTTAARSHAQQTSELALAQDRQDVHQAQLDQTQRAQGVRQDLLDDQQAQLETGTIATPSDIDSFHEQAAEELQEALRGRAEDALARAEAGRQRAVDTLRRLQAAGLRRGG